MCIGVLIFLIRRPLSRFYARMHRELPFGVSSYEMASTPKAIARSGIATFVIGVLLLLNGLGIIHLPIKT